MAAAIGVALAAAVAFGWSTALMHYSASGAPETLTGTKALLQHLVVQRRWLLGMAASLGGLALHALALRLGSLALVQPLVVTGLVFSFVFRAALDRRLPPGNVIAWVVVTAAGLALFLAVASATRSHSGVNQTSAAIVLGTGALVAASAFIASIHAPRRHVGLLLGIAGGVVFGLIAGTLKAATGSASHGALWTSWPVYVIIPLGISGFLLNQRAYHRAPLSKSLPVLNTLNPVVAVGFGAAVFHERPPGQPLSIFLEAVGLAAVLASIFFLAREEEPADAVQTAPSHPPSDDQVLTS
jgi:drug/metabolite transporter (DMT)-like permease